MGCGDQKLWRKEGTGRSKLDMFEFEIKAILSTGSMLKYIGTGGGDVELSKV